MSARIITIVQHEHGFTVHEGERYNYGLGWDEMLGQIAAMTLPPSRVGGLFPMNTPEELEAIEQRRAARREEYRRQSESIIPGENEP